MENKASFFATLMSLFTSCMGGAVAALLVLDGAIENSALIYLLRYITLIMSLVNIVIFIVSTCYENTVKPKQQLYLMISALFLVMHLVL